MNQVLENVPDEGGISLFDIFPVFSGEFEGLYCEEFNTHPKSYVKAALLALKEEGAVVLDQKGKVWKV
jgi:hypothetical protein